MEPSPVLCEATFDQIVEELKRRTTCGLLALVQPHKTNPDNDRILMNYWGGVTTAIGLAHRARAVMTADSMRDDDE